jgi:predicted molibdopterin-dependent oxidoreductase YjgC
MVEEAEKGTLKALYVLGENPVRALPQSSRVRKALEQLELLVVQDVLHTETSQLAHVVLPGAAFCETSGSFTNLEGRVRGFDAAVHPPGRSRQDWEILDGLMQRLGGHSFGSLFRIREEIIKRIPEYASLDRDEFSGWLKERGGREPICFAEVTEIKEKSPDAVYPHVAILGSKRVHLGSGTRTGHSRRVRRFGLGGSVELNPMDGSQLGVTTGDMVQVTSPHGEIVRKVKLDRGLRPGLTFVPTAFHGNGAMDLLPLWDLSDAESPGWKSCPVRLEKVV